MIFVAGRLPILLPFLVVSISVGGMTLCVESNLIFNPITLSPYGESLMIGRYLISSLHGIDTDIILLLVFMVFPILKKS